jgi:hypothetical protein
VGADGIIGSSFRNDVNGNSGQRFPGYYMSPYRDVYLMALVGTFTDDNGAIVGQPFEVGSGPTVLAVPTGATRLQLGINDDIFADNLGSFTVTVTENVTSPVPVPGGMLLLAPGLACLAATMRRFRG